MAEGQKRGGFRKFSKWLWDRMGWDGMERDGHLHRMEWMGMCEGACECERETVIVSVKQ